VSQAGDAAFREVQRFRQWWVWLLVYGGAALTWYGFVQQIIFGQPFGTNPAPDWMMWLIWLLFGIGFPLLFHRLKLIVEVRPDHILIRYVPFVTRLIPFGEIERHEARSYEPIQEFGGWGIRGWGSKRRAYSVSGRSGVELTLYDGRRILIGSLKPEELDQAIGASVGKSSSSRWEPF